MLVYQPIQLNPENSTGKAKEFCKPNDVRKGLLESIEFIPDNEPCLLVYIDANHTGDKKKSIDIEDRYRLRVTSIKRYVIGVFMPKYNRTLDELRKHAVLAWPEDLMEEVAKISVLPLMYQTQDKFLSILTISDSHPTTWKAVLRVAKDIPYNLFLKHLMVLSDLGGEALNKLTPISRYFPEGKMKYEFNGRCYSYSFKEIQNDTSLTNNALFVNGKNLVKGHVLTSKIEDTIMLLLYGYSATNDKLPVDVKNKCTIGLFLGKSKVLQTFLKQSYIRVSRQITGALANALGQVAQKYVFTSLKSLLPGWN